jgi:hypothetical protein
MISYENSPQTVLKILRNLDVRLINSKLKNLLKKGYFVCKGFDPDPTMYLDKCHVIEHEYHEKTKSDFFLIMTNSDDLKYINLTVVITDRKIHESEVK